VGSSKKRSPGISIRQVADKAGVSVTTVSHTISGNRPVSPATVDRVSTAMAELGYEPSHAAQALKLGITQTIGVLVPDITNNFFAKLATGVEDVAYARGHNMILGNTGFEPARELEYLKMVRRRAVDGLIYAAGSPVSGFTIEELSANFPVVLADEEISVPKAVLVTSDHRSGGSLVGRHLTELGHRSALVITGPAGLRSSEDRLDGFREHFGGPTIVVTGDFQQRSGSAAVAGHPPDGTQPYSAIFALNDLMALGAIKGLRAMGFSIPTDVSVVGFDDIPTAELMHPSLTTVRQPAFMVGRLAAERLLDGLEGKQTTTDSRTVLPVELMRRESTAPPNSSLNI